MTSGFGVDPAADGTSGTSSSDIRKIQGGLYPPGIISGCLVTTSANSMQFTVAAGVVAIKTATGEIVLAPVAQTTVTTSAAPSSGSRTDLIYVQQRYPSIEGDANIVVGVGTTLPARAQLITKYTIGAGITNTNSAVRSYGYDYSIPYGASLGKLYQYSDPHNGVLWNDLTRRGHGSFHVPTDRKLRITLKTTLYALGAVGFDNSKYCEYGFLPNVNGGDFVLWTTGGLHQSWQTYQWEGYYDVPAGNVDFQLGYLRAAGPGNAVVAKGTFSGYGREGTVVEIWDAGPVV